ncbi:hypothetical protein WJX72_000423 [[Myrmecia] bisecta]|uniref:Nuclear pore protein n=1 Tax=[Myrmecia] bisecta TaxID=41462 RepID=A0AAW1R443_9CHLO
MAAMDWDSLLQNSEALAARDSQGLPRVDRDIRQVEQYSQKLRAKAQRIDPSADTLAATRLLAHEGLNTRKLTRALQTFELKPTYEDVFEVETSTVEEYLQQMHQMTVITAIQDAQRDTMHAFEEYMDECMEADWAAEKRQLFDEVMPSNGLRPGAIPSGYASSYAPTPIRSPGGFTSGAGPGTPGFASGANAAQLTGREKAYTDVVHELNEAGAQRQPFNAVAKFAAACASEPSGGQRSTMQKCWELLQAILDEAKSVSAGARSHHVEALLRGARKHLEAGHASYVQNIIHNNRAQANLGGGPSKLGLICAFIRIREKDAGAMDFDQHGGIDTTWQCIYYCLRSGFHQEALQMAKSIKDHHLGRAGHDFSSYLKEWVDNQGRVSNASAAALSQEVERLLKHSSATKAASHKYKVMLYTLLAGDRKAAEHLLRETSTLFSTIEDFMWFKVALVRPPRPDRPTGNTMFSDGMPGEVYTLTDLQTYLTQYPDTHYSHGGREPLLYVMVLLYSLQFRGAVTFLAKHASAKTYRVDAVHLAIALQHHQALDAGGEGDIGARSGVDIASVIHRYGRSFVTQAPELALEYYMLAAAAKGGSLADKGALLRELLTDSRAFGFLLGSGGAGGEAGAIERFVPDGDQRRQLIEAVAHDCQMAAQLDWAVELYMYAGRPTAALNILNQQLSDGLEASLVDPAKAEEVEQVIRRGNAAAANLVTAHGVADEREKQAFASLKSSLNLLQASRRGETGVVQQTLDELQFIPQEEFRLHRCVADVRSGALHTAVAARLPALLQAVGQALAATGQANRLRTIAGFASELPQRVPQHVFQELNRLHSAVS